MKNYLISLLLILFSLTDSFGQCGSGTPVYIVDLSADPNMNWTSDLVLRDDTCCGSISTCIQFIVTLNPAAEGILLDICEGALPGGALFYQVDCGGPMPIGNAICLYGVGPHSITFCKPGGNPNRYCLTSVAEPGGGQDITIAEGCYDSISSIGFEPSTILWRSVYPGAIGSYDSYLDCNLGCADVIVTPSANPPPYVDFQICGFALGLCDISGVCDTVRVYFNDSLDVNISPINPMVCFGDNTTSITANPTGGEAPFTYLWSTGETSATIDVGIGNYSVVIDDAGGCYSANSSITVGEFTMDISTDAGADQLVCNQNPQIQLNGSVQGVSTGKWIGGNGVFSPNDSTLNAVYTPTFPEIISGSLALTLLTTNNSTCPPDSDIVTFTFTGFIGIPQISSDSVSCFQGSDGGASVLINSGFNSYSYLWDDPANSTDSAIGNLSAGSYNVQVTDSLGCLLFTSVTVYEPPALIVDSLFSQDLFCFNDNSGIAGVYVSGGSPPYSYNWGANANNQTTLQAIDLSAGSYDPIILDSKGCFLDTTISISEPPPLVLMMDSISISLCYGDGNAQATVSATGGTPSYSYLWDANAGSQTSATAINLSVGTYTVYLSDYNLCSDSLEIIIDKPDSLTLIGNTLSNVDCFGGSEGSAEVIVSGGTPSYSYLWDANAQNQTGSVALNLGIGIYSVTVTDSNLCQSVSQVEILGPDSTFYLTPEIQDVSCFGLTDGSANIIVSGASPPYTYLWDSNAGNQTTSNATNLAPGSYWLWVSDNNNCNDSIQISILEPAPLVLMMDSISLNLCFGDNDAQATVSAAGGTPSYSYLWDANAGSQTTATAINLSNGIYMAYVYDSYLCSDSLEIIIDKPDSLTLIGNTLSNVDCFGGIEGSAEIIVSGGTPSYTYLWDANAQNQTGSVALNLGIGIYSVTVTDSNLCQSVSQIEILGPDSTFYFTPEIQDVSCFGYNDGSANMIVSGASPPYSYLWDANAGNQTSASATDLAPGSYWLYVSDSNNCSDSIQISISEPFELLVSSFASDVICNGDSTGSALLQVSGGSLPYSYQWDDNAMNQNTINAIGLPEGVYSYLVTDDNNCSFSGFVEISEPEPITLIASNDQIICVGIIVEVSAQASGGTGGLVYYWSDLGEGQFKNASPSVNTIYNVVAVDSLGCASNYDSVEVVVNNIFLDSLQVFNSGSICEGETSSVTAQFNGQSPISSYTWNNNLGSTYGPVSVSPMQSTWYTFTVIDVCQNSLSDSTLIEVYPIPVIDIEISTNEGCAPLEVTFTNLGQQENVNYVWVFGDGGVSIEESPSYIYEQAGDFLVELSLFSSFGCSSNSTNTHFVHVDPQPLSNFNANPWETDITNPLIEFTNTSSSDAIFFTWNFGDGDSIMVENPSHSYLDIGVFNVRLETENVFGCISSVIKTVTINPSHDVIIPNAFTPNLNGSQGGYYDPNDLSNDVFYPFADYVSDFHMMIFNRWGELIFESFDINYGWDGYFKNELSQIGAYVYKVDITFVDGYNKTVQGKIKLMN